MRFRNQSAAIRTIREKMGLTQTELGRLLGFGSGQMVSNAERGYSTIPLKRLVNVLKRQHGNLLTLLVDAKLEDTKDQIYKVIGRK